MIAVIATAWCWVTAVFLSLKHLPHIDRDKGSFVPPVICPCFSSAPSWGDVFHHMNRSSHISSRSLCLASSHHRSISDSLMDELSTWLSVQSAPWLWDDVTSQVHEEVLRLDSSYARPHHSGFCCQSSSKTSFLFCFNSLVFQVMTINYLLCIDSDSPDMKHPVPSGKSINKNSKK